MRKKYLFGRCKVPMNLQIFAEGEGDGAGAGDGNGGGAGGSGDGDGAGGAEPMSFDGFLQGDGNQAEFDRRVQQAINTAVGKAQEKWQLLTDDKVSEAEKLAKMNKEEKAQYLQQKKLADIEQREAAVVRKELKAEAGITLAEKGLPASLLEVLNYTDAETCKASISAVEKAFKDAVQKGVEERLKGGKPPKRAAGEGDEDNSANAFVSVIKDNQSKR